MTSQGQRFRRRALRRGYKVDEVDAFLDRVEATLAGEPIGAPVTGQEVHDVVFRVRFGGYDEWQVDLHLDRVERQLTELEERGGPPPREERPLPPLRGEERGAPLPPHPVSPMGPPPGAPGRFEERGYPERDRAGYPSERGGYAGGFEPGRHGKMDMTAEIRLPDRDALPGRGPVGAGAAGAGPGGSMPPAGPLSDVQRIDRLRRTFQPRRFGSGYDPAQVDRLFDAILSAMSGRGGGPISAADLDAVRFNLVPGGYFEADVDAAMKEVRDILRRA